MPKIVCDETNLNPMDNDYVAEVIGKSKDDQLWYFLDECVPQKEAIPLVVRGIEIEDCMEELPLVPYCGYVADMLFYMETTEEVDTAGFDYMIPFMPLLKNCYKPYFCMYSVPEDATSADLERLAELMENNQILYAWIEEKENSVKLKATFIGCGRNVEMDVYVYEIAE